MRWLIRTRPRPGFRPGQVSNGVTVTPGVTSEAHFEKEETRHIDQELAHVDDADLERGLGRVRINHRIESSEERLSKGH